jgi:hypothetical protein
MIFSRISWGVEGEEDKMRKGKQKQKQKPRK